MKTNTRFSLDLWVHTWKRSAVNTTWCLLGCAVGDFGTILFFQFTQIRISPIMVL